MAPPREYTYHTAPAPKIQKHRRTQWERSEEPEHQRSLCDSVSKKEQRSSMVCQQYSFLIMTLIRTTSMDLLNGRGKHKGPTPGQRIN